eukprot:snap_masked-scaffold_25-processed-gene-2.52-mRNA-1 protein AED:1.00 eAED:1.00 QI:0/-1/0/0/-1/1/1/0/71
MTSEKVRIFQAYQVSSKNNQGKMILYEAGKSDKDHQARIFKGRRIAEFKLRSRIQGKAKCKVILFKKDEKI